MSITFYDAYYAAVALALVMTIYWAIQGMVRMDRRYVKHETSFGWLLASGVTVLVVALLEVVTLVLLVL